MTEIKRSALKWLESLPPPSITAPDADLSPAPISYVPPGDARGQKGKKGEEEHEHGVFRWRQPRYFPCAVIMGDPVVYYAWEKDPENNLLTALQEISLGVTHVGTSHSMAVVGISLGKMPHPPRFVPDPKGKTFLRVPAPGRLEELDNVYRQTIGVRRPTPECEILAPYRSVKDRLYHVRESELNFLTLRMKGTLQDVDTGAYIGRALRRAVMSVMGDDAPPPVHGHNKKNHIAWLPLPDVGHVHASGRIMGIGIVLPMEMNPEERRKVLVGINEVRELHLPDGRVMRLDPPIPGERLPVALSPRTWTESCCTWATVTPVVLDRPPKRLTGERVSKALSESLVYAGYPEPSDIKVSSFSLFQGAPPAFRILAQKPRYHAVVRFKDPVGGPVIAGRLRYFGVGLFRPLPSLSVDGGSP